MPTTKTKTNVKKIEKKIILSTTETKEIENTFSEATDFRTI
jgi:hypothetical protein